MLLYNTEEQELDSLLYYDYDDQVVISSITTCNNNLLKKSCNSIYYYYNNIKNKLKTSNELSYNPLQLCKWIEFYEKPVYLNIIFLLLQLKTMHLSGISKILAISRPSLQQYLLSLRRYNIIKFISQKDKEVQQILRILKLDLYHWKKAEFFILTKEAEYFFSPICFSDVLDKNVLDRINNWILKIRQSHKDVNQTNFSEEEAIEQMVKKIRNQPDIDSR